VIFEEKALVVVGLDVVMVALDGDDDQVQVGDRVRVSSAAARPRDVRAWYPTTGAASCPANVAARR
jgi:hypothetical protein